MFIYLEVKLSPQNILSTLYNAFFVFLFWIIAGMELGRKQQGGLMDQHMLHSVQYKPTRHIHTSSPLLVKEGPCFGMLTFHG